MLRGNHIVLRPLQESDLPIRLSMVNNPEVQRVVIGLVVDQNTLEDLESWFELVSKDQFSEQWAITTLAGQYIGDIDLHSINVVRGEAWISPMIGDPNYMTNPMYRKEAIALAAQHAFSEKNVDSLAIDLPDSDTQGLQILAELGFTQTEEPGNDILTGVQTVTLELHPDNLTWQPNTK